jgi:hypothetical protein
MRVLGSQSFTLLKYTSKCHVVNDVEPFLGAFHECEKYLRLPAEKANTTAVPKKNVSKPDGLVRRSLAHASVGPLCPRNSYHLHALASDANLRQLELPP